MEPISPKFRILEPEETAFLCNGLVNTSTLATDIHTQ
jgi:hypothetical protein